MLQGLSVRFWVNATTELSIGRSTRVLDVSRFKIGTFVIQSIREHHTTGQRAYDMSEQGVCRLRDYLCDAGLNNDEVTKVMQLVNQL